MFVVMLKKSEFKPKRWREISAALELPEDRKEVAVTRIPGLLPVEEGWKVSFNTCPPDEWMAGENIDGSRQYLIHSKSPRFIAEILDDVDDLRIGGFQYQMNTGQWLSDFFWLDPPPEDLTALLNEAESFIIEYDQELGID